MLMLPERSYSTLDHIHNVDALSLLRALADKSVDAIITDMPYGTTACSWDTVIDLPAWWTQVKRVLKPRGVFVTTAAQPFTSALVMSNPAWFKYEWIWHKSQSTQMMNARFRPLMEHESILVFSGTRLRSNQFVNEKMTYNPQGVREIQLTVQGKKRATTINNMRGTINKQYVQTMTDFPKTILRFNVEVGLHPTQKPVALYEYLIQTYTRPGELVLDPFSGSGTTAIAARKTGRHFICGDSSAEYVEMSRKRLATTDPYQHRPLPDGRKQLSMFAGVMA